MRAWKSIDIRARVAGLAIIGLGALAVAWWLGSPLFINQTVNEAFPTAVPTARAVDAMAKTDAMTKDAMATGSAMQEPAPVTAGAPMVTSDPDTSADTSAALSSGSFTVVDAIHKGEGRASIYEMPDGQRVLRFEDFKVTNGPDLFVYLSGHEAPRSAGELHDQGDFELGRLKGNVGNQNYDLPADLDLSRFRSVVIYCKQFSVVFSTAMLAPD
jgi:hypothetical protein